VDLRRFRERRDTLESTLTLARTERLERQFAYAHGTAKRTGSQQGKLDAALGDHGLGAGEQASRAAQALAFRQQAEVPVAKQRAQDARHHAESKRDQQHRRDCPYGEAILAALDQSQPAARIRDVERDQRLEGLEQAEQAGHPNEREVEQAGHEHPAGAHRENDLTLPVRRLLGGCRSTVPCPARIARRRRSASASVTLSSTPSSFPRGPSRP
jgi:glutaredoxin